MTREAPIPPDHLFASAPPRTAPLAVDGRALLALQAAWLEWTTKLLRTNRMPLSGDVEQWIRTWGEAVGQVGLLNVNVAGSGNPGLERDITSTWGYGRQLGRILDVLAPLVEKNAAQIDDEDAVTALGKMVHDIALRRKRATVADVLAAVGAWKDDADFQAKLTALRRELEGLSG